MASLSQLPEHPLYRLVYALSHCPVAKQLDTKTAAGEKQGKHRAAMMIPCAGLVEGAAFPNH
jgi:hypothetical protein